MKKVIALSLLIILIVVAGVGLKIKKQENLGVRYLCNFGGYTVYSEYDFFYFEKGAERYVYAPFGIYLQKPTRDGWMLKLFNEKYENSVHSAYTQWIKQRKNGKGEAITCTRVQSTAEFPTTFQEFIKNHNLVFKTHKPELKELGNDVEIVSENVTNNP